MRRLKRHDSENQLQLYSMLAQKCGPVDFAYKCCTKTCYCHCTSQSFSSIKAADRASTAFLHITWSHGHGERTAWDANLGSTFSAAALVQGTPNGEVGSVVPQSCQQCRCHVNKNSSRWTRGRWLRYGHRHHFSYTPQVVNEYIFPHLLQ